METNTFWVPGQARDDKILEPILIRQQTLALRTIFGHFSPGNTVVPAAHGNFISLLTLGGNLGIMQVLNFIIPYRKCL